MSPADLLSRLDIHSGQVYERERLTERIDRYLEGRRKEGYYEARLSMSATLADEDRAVSLALTAAQGPLVRVVFAGDAVPADRREELVPVAREGSVDEDLLEDSSNRIEEYFRAQGYRDVSAPHSREQKGGELVVTFTVRRGGQYRVEAIDIVGSAAIPAGELAPRLRVRAGQPFSAAALDADLAQIEEAYRRLGFAAVRADVTTELRPAAGDQHVPVAIRIRDHREHPDPGQLGENRGQRVGPGKRPCWRDEPCTRSAVLVRQAGARRGRDSAAVREPRIPERLR